MPKAWIGSSLSRLALRHKVNRVLAERGIDVRIAVARSVAERNMLGEYYLVDRLKRHLILRDHVELHEFAQEIGLPPASECAGEEGAIHNRKAT